MKKLIAFDLRKILRQKATYICLILSMLSAGVMSPLMNNLAELIMGTVMGETILVKVFTDGFMSIFIMIILSSFICGDFSFKVASMIIGRGYSATQFYTSKLIVGYIMGCVMFLLNIIAVYAWYAVKEGVFLAITGEVILRWLLLLLYIAAEVSFITLVAFLFRKTSTVILISLFLPVTISLLFTVLEMHVIKTDVSISSYIHPGQLSDIEDFASTKMELLRSVLVSVVYSAAFYLLGTNIFKKQDV